MKRKPGFTLIEILVAVSLTAMVTGSAFYMLFASQRFWDASSKNCRKLALMQDILACLTDEIKFSDDAVLSGPKLNLTSQEGVISYDYFEQKVRRKKGNSTAYLSEKGEIDSLSFFAQPGNKLIKISILKDSLKLETSALCRN